MCDAKKGRWHVGYWVALVPNILAVTRFNTIRRVEAAGSGPGTNDDVLLAKLNDYQLGGVYISLAI